MKSSVLIIEDDQYIRESLSLVLESDGYRTLAVSSGEDALRWLKSHGDAPCLVLLDLLLPAMRGEEFLEKLRQELPRQFEKLAVVLMSALPHFDRKPLRAPVVAQVKKPFDLSQVLELVEAHCPKPSSLSSA